MLVGKSESVVGGYAPLVHLKCTVPDRFQNLSSKGGELEQNIPGVVEGGEPCACAHDGPQATARPSPSSFPSH